MNSIEAISLAGSDAVQQRALTSSIGNAFQSALAQGIEQVESDSRNAAAALSALATDPTVATHDVILAMEQAKLSLQLAAEIRQRVLDAYKELTGMQI